MMAHTSARSAKIDFAEKHETSYCIPNWLRDEQIKVAIRKVKGRIEAYIGKRAEPIAVVAFGPSLKDTWEQVKGFKYVISCSGAHRFLIDNGIIPTWHVEVVPRAHKIELLGQPHPDVTYLPASTCHPKYFDHLAGYQVQLWHVFSNEADALRTLPKNEWALTGGPDVGMRAMAIARFLGFTELHVFGMDGCAGKEENSHAMTHPNAPKKFLDCEYPEGSGRIWRTTIALLECAKSMPHELDMLKDCNVTFYGDTLVKAIADNHQKNPPQFGTTLGISNPELISEDYRVLNRRLHEENLAYGVGAGKHADTVKKLVEKTKAQSVLDYGCGKGYLAKALPFPIWEYDPAIPGKEEAPRPAEVVCCLDVLEHVEPDKIDIVLNDLRRCVLKVGYFVIHTGPSGKFLADGRNAHLIQEKREWWEERLGKHFKIAQIFQTGPLLHCVVGKRSAFVSAIRNVKEAA